MAPVKISVIIPVYKVEKYLKCCLDSVLKQTFTDFEVIVVDDGSPDKCPDICDQYAKLDKRIRVIHKENGGVSTARNIGLDLCKGKYICFVDSDDYIEPDYLQTMLSDIESGDYDFTSCVANFVDDQGKLICRNNYIYKKKEIEKDIWEKYFRTNLIEDAPWNKLYKRDLFSDIRFIEDIIFEDSEVIVRILKKCKKVLFTSEYLYNYRIRGGSILDYNSKEINDTGFYKKKMDIFKVYQLCANELKGTQWEKGYYKRMIYTCAEYSTQICGMGDKALRKQLLSYFKSARKKYSLNQFELKERTAILLKLYVPRIYKILIRGKYNEK